MEMGSIGILSLRFEHQKLKYLLNFPCFVTQDEMKKSILILQRPIDRKLILKGQI